MKIKKAASIPLVLHDPFFSIWSSADHLYDKDPVHWSGARQQMRGYLTVDGKTYIFLGDKEMHRILPQKSIDVTATTTEYCFENDEVHLKCRFTSPLLLDDMLLVSRPCTYVDFEVTKKKASSIVLDFEISADLVRQTKDNVIGFDGKYKDYNYSQMGRAIQMPLGGSNDMAAFDWGYVYLACKETDASLKFDKSNEKIRLKMNFHNQKQAGFILAYDDLLSINYFGQWRKAYWTEKYTTILNAIAAAFADKESVLERAAQLDHNIETKAYEIGGAAYAFLCNMSFRQTIAAHKLITDEEGEILFLSKENASNGCIGTLDVSYPSSPLFLLYDTEYVKGMLRPIFKFAACDAWEFDFAPHDVGRYPYAWGQVYGYKEAYGMQATEKHIWKQQKSGVYPAFYMYPAGSNLFLLNYQMPVEECGNILILMAAICKSDGNAEFARPYWNVIKQWKNYLVKYGTDPGDQLCTDDFAGRLSHNVNLSVKAIIGIESYAILADMLGEEAEAVKYHKLAGKMAADWEIRANSGDHYSLVFDDPDTWSLKYNLVWDRMWGCKLFSDTVYEKEISYYIKKTCEYGTPLDSRKSYAKSDWTLWCATMTKEKALAEKLIKPVAHYLELSESRIPFGDWYDAETGLYYKFINRSVQGGIFMPMLFEKNQEEYYETEI